MGYFFASGISSGAGAVWGYGFGGVAAHMWMTMMQFNRATLFGFFASDQPQRFLKKRKEGKKVLDQQCSNQEVITMAVLDIITVDVALVQPGRRCGWDIVVVMNMKKGQPLIFRVWTYPPRCLSPVIFVRCQSC